MKGKGIRELTSDRENNAFRIPEVGSSLMVLRNQKRDHIARGQRADRAGLII